MPVRKWVGVWLNAQPKALTLHNPAAPNPNPSAYSNQPYDRIWGHKKGTMEYVS